MLIKASKTISRDLTIHERLICAIQDGNIPNVKTIIKEGANIKYRGKIQECPLDVAAFYGNVEILKILIEHGADVNALDDIHRSAMDIADQEKNKAAVTYLKSQGGKFNVRFLNLSTFRPCATEMDEYDNKVRKQRALQVANRY